MNEQPPQPGVSDPEKNNVRFLQRRHREVLVIALFVLVLAFVLRVRADQRVHVVGLASWPAPQTCWSRVWLGVPCPGCGLTRSFICLAQGDVRASWNYHRVGWLIALAIALQIPYRLLAIRYPLHFPVGGKWVTFIVVLLFGLLLVNWLVNLAILGFRDSIL